MKRFTTFLAEAKIAPNKLSAGNSVDLVGKGRSAKQFGMSGENLFGGKAKVVGWGSLDPASTSKTGLKFNKKLVLGQYVLGKDFKDLTNNYKEIWDTEEIRYGRFENANHRMKEFIRAIVKSEGMKPGYPAIFFQITDGERKGEYGYARVDMDNRWSVSDGGLDLEFDAIQ